MNIEKSKIDKLIKWHSEMLSFGAQAFEREEKHKKTVESLEVQFPRKELPATKIAGSG